MNFIKIKDNLLTKTECDDVIKWSCDHIGLQPDENKENFTGYDYCHLMDISQDYAKCFSPKPLRPLYRAINELKESAKDVKWMMGLFKIMKKNPLLKSIFK